MSVALLLALHTTYAPECNDPQVTKLVVQLAGESLDYPNLGVRGTEQVSKDSDTGSRFCRGQIYAKDDVSDYRDIFYSTEVSGQKRGEVFVRIEGM